MSSSIPPAAREQTQARQDRRGLLCIGPECHPPTLSLFEMAAARKRAKEEKSKGNGGEVGSPAPSQTSASKKKPAVTVNATHDKVDNHSYQTHQSDRAPPAGQPIGVYGLWWHFEKLRRAFSGTHSHHKCRVCWHAIRTCVCTQFGQTLTTPRCVAVGGVDLVVLFHHEEVGRASNTAKLAVQYGGAKAYVVLFLTFCSIRELVLACSSQA